MAGMSTFNESQVRRGATTPLSNSGSFADKPQSAPEVALLERDDLHELDGFLISPPEAPAIRAGDAVLFLPFEGDPTPARVSDVDSDGGAVPATVVAIRGEEYTLVSRYTPEGEEPQPWVTHRRWVERDTRVPNQVRTERSIMGEAASLANQVHGFSAEQLAAIAEHYQRVTLAPGTTDPSGGQYVDGTVVIDDFLLENTAQYADVIERAEIELGNLSAAASRDRTLTTLVGHALVNDFRARAAQLIAAERGLNDPALQRAIQSQRIPV